MVPMFRVQFHTGMLKLQPKGRNKHVAVFPLSDLDDAYKDKRSLLLTYTFIDPHRNRFARGFKLELVFSGLSEEDIRDYLSQDEEFVQEELALWDLTPSGPLDGSLCFFPGSVEAIAGIYLFFARTKKAA